MVPSERDYMLRVRMSDEERQMLDWLADEEGLTASDIVRQLVRKEYRARNAGTPSELAKSKRKR